ncbi:MAG: hypothetical protein ACYCVZ_17095 [Streptosporangiaceae bacterium]
MATAPAPANAVQQAPKAAAAAAAPAAVPFRVGTQNTTNLDGYSNSWVLGTGTALPNYEPSVNSFLRGVWINVQMEWSSSNSASVAYSGDGVFALLAQIAFLDTQQRPIIQVTGYQMAGIINKFGGYFEVGDPRADVNFKASTGTGAGSINFTLWVPLEINQRTGIGSALNKNSSQTYTLALTPAQTVAAVFSTGPTAADITTNPTVTIHEDGWWQPQALDVSGAPNSQNPVAPNTWSYWLQSSYTGLNGTVQQQLTTGLGNTIRMVALNVYDSSTGLSRSTADGYFPVTPQFIYKGTTLKNWQTTLWESLMGKNYGLTSGTKDTADGLEYGVYVLWQFMQDFFFKPGDGANYALLNTDQGDQFQFQGDFTGSTNMYELVNYIATVGNPSILRAQR